MHFYRHTDANCLSDVHAKYICPCIQHAHSYKYKDLEIPVARSAEMRMVKSPHQAGS
jgi:hypothetical protein